MIALFLIALFLAMVGFFVIALASALSKYEIISTVLATIGGFSVALGLSCAIGLVIGEVSARFLG